MFIAQGALSRAARVQLLVLALDGTLTSGETWFRHGNEQLKAFHEHDRVGLQRLHDAGLHTALITTGELPAERKIAEELCIRFSYEDTKDKRLAFLSLLRQAKLNAERTAYMGDDTVDLAVLRRCGLACAPADAHEDVRRMAHFVTSARAGYGAVREVCDFILRAQARG